MLSKRNQPVALPIIVALAVGLFLGTDGSQATTWRPNDGPGTTLSSTALLANANITSDYAIPTPNSNFAGVFAFSSPEFTVSDVTDFHHVGFLTSTATLGLINAGCTTDVPVPFSLIDASTDNSAGNLAAPAGPADNRLQNYLQDDGDINNDKTTALTALATTTLTAAATAGVTASLTVVSSAGFVAGESVTIGPPSVEMKTIASIPDATHINLTAPVTFGHTIGATVAKAAQAGVTTSLSVASSAGFVAGESVTIGPASAESQTIASIPDATHINLTAAVTFSHSPGETVVTPDIAARTFDGVPDGAEWYPTGANTGAAGVTPSHRYYGQTTVPGTTSLVTLQLILFEPGDLAGVGNSEWLAAGHGNPGFSILNDPYVAPSNSVISDFCTPLSTSTTLCGISDTTGGAGTNPFVQDLELDCDGGGDVRSTNPAVAGTYSFRNVSISQRDFDNDGHENGLDTCPATVDPLWDPRIANGGIILPNNGAMGNGSDDLNGNDGIPDSCDTSADADADNDNDGWLNRLDNCPLVFNPATSPPNTGQADLDAGVGGGFAVDGGPRADGMGPECETDDLVPNGHYHYSWIIYRVCLGGAPDGDGDGVCDAQDPNDASNDSDGDGMLDRRDNCISRANPQPAGLSQISSDFNGSGTVLIDDITAVAGAFGKLTSQAGYRALLEGGSQNGNIAIDDITAAAGAFNETC